MRAVLEVLAPAWLGRTLGVTIDVRIAAAAPFVIRER
jgi:hypothetical protein